MSKAKQVCVSVVVFGALLAGIPRAQAQSGQQESIAEAARRSREQKKEAAKPATVITNDTLEPLKPEAPAAATTPSAAATSDTNTSTAAPAATASTSAPPAAPATTEAPEDRAAKQANLSSLKQQIANLQKEADLAQRALNLANDDFYSKPDFSKDEEGKAKLDALKSDVAQKLDELARLKTQLTESGGTLEEKPAQGESQGQSPTPSEPQAQPQSSGAPQPQ